MSVASPSRAAFPGSQAGRHPRLHFRGLLRLHSNYGPLDLSTAQGGLCRRASIHPVTRTNRLPATRSNRQLSGWFLPPLVIRAFWAHVESRRGAVAWALWASLRFLSPLIKPDVRISRIRLPDRLHLKAHGGGQDGPDVVGSHRVPRTQPYRGNAWCLATTPCGRFRLRLDVELPPMAPELLGCCQDHRQSPLLAIIKSVPEVRALCSAGITRPHSSYGPVRRPRGPSPKVTSRARPSSPPGLPRLPVSLFQRAVPTTPADQDGCTCRLLPPPARPSPDHRRVGIRDFTFEACSGFTRITARWIAQPPKAAFVTGLRSIRLPG